MIEIMLCVIFDFFLFDISFDYENDGYYLV